MPCSSSSGSIVIVSSSTPQYLQHRRGQQLGKGGEVVGAQAEAQQVCGRVLQQVQQLGLAAAAGTTCICPAATGDSKKPDNVGHIGRRRQELCAP